MLRRLTLTLIPQARDNISDSATPLINSASPAMLASLFHGVLMEQVTPDYGDILHNTELKPFSQYLTVETDKENGQAKLHWTVQTLNDEAAEQLIVPLMTDDKQCIYLSHKDCYLSIVDRKIESSSFEELVHQYYVKEERQHFLNLRIITPSAFRSSGSYVFLPDIRLIFQSLIRKYDAFSPQYTVGGEETLRGLVTQTTINSYRLRSTYFHLEGVRIPAFLGDLSIRLSGSETAARLGALLVAYGEYSGVGIKTSLGMGAIKKQERTNYT